MKKTRLTIPDAERKALLLVVGAALGLATLFLGVWVVVGGLSSVRDLRQAEQEFRDVRPISVGADEESAEFLLMGIQFADSEEDVDKKLSAADESFRFGEQSSGAFQKHYRFRYGPQQDRGRHKGSTMVEIFDVLFRDGRAVQVERVLISPSGGSEAVWDLESGERVGG